MLYRRAVGNVSQNRAVAGATFKFLSKPRNKLHSRCKHQKQVILYSSAVCLETLSVLGRQMVSRK